MENELRVWVSLVAMRVIWSDADGLCRDVESPVLKLSLSNRRRKWNGWLGDWMELAANGWVAMIRSGNGELGRAMAAWHDAMAQWSNDRLVRLQWRPPPTPRVDDIRWVFSSKVHQPQFWPPPMIVHFVRQATHLANLGGISFTFIFSLMTWLSRWPIGRSIMAAQSNAKWKKELLLAALSNIVHCLLYHLFIGQTRDTLLFSTFTVCYSGTLASTPLVYILPTLLIVWLHFVDSCFESEWLISSLSINKPVIFFNELNTQQTINIHTKLIYPI